MTICYQRMRNCFKIFLVFLSLFFIGDVTLGSPSAQPSEPERIILNLTEHPSTSQAISWRTMAPVSKPQAQIIPAAESGVLDQNAITVPAVTEVVKLDNETTAYYHSVVFKSLKPNTLYAYRLGDGELWSEWNQFRTASNVDETFTFAYFGDIQIEIQSMCPRIFRAAYTKAPHARFWLFVGDLVNNGDCDEQWAELFYALGWIPRMTPMILLPGNHEYTDRRFTSEKDYRLHSLWRPQFVLPENGPDGLEETVYVVDYQGVRFVMLNGSEKLEEQAKWLDTALSRSSQRWTIVAIHQPFYSGGKNRDNFYSQKLFSPVMDKYSVDLVLQGHDHIYSRTYKLRNGHRVPDNKQGTVYVVSVSGPKFYFIDHDYEDLLAKAGTGRQLFQMIHVDKNRLRYESFNALGELYDSFELKK